MPRQIIMRQDRYCMDCLAVGMHWCHRSFDTTNVCLMQQVF